MKIFEQLYCHHYYFDKVAKSWNESLHSGVIAFNIRICKDYLDIDEVSKNVDKFLKNVF